MTAAELMTPHVPEDVSSPVPTGQYIVAYVAFYEQGFGMPLKDRRRWPEGGGWMRANQNSPRELGLYPKIDLTSLSSNSAKTA
jgi:hypothetical protein